MTLNIDQPARTDDLFDAPVGTCVEMYGNRYYKEPDGWHSPSNGYVQSPDAINGATVRFVGTREMEETLHQFKQRFSTVCFGRARQSRVDLGPVREALNRLGVPDYGLVPGMYVHWCDADLRDRLPVGTLLMCGDPEVWNSLGVWVVARGQRWEHVFGSHSGYEQKALRVYQYPDGFSPATWPTPPEGDQQALISEFKVRAWEVGERAKRTSSWCGDFENAMGRLDISATIRSRVAAAGVTVAPNPVPTPPVSVRIGHRDEVNALPEGAVLRYPDRDTLGSSWNMTVRSDTSYHAGGGWRTEHLCGPNSGRYGGTVTVLYNGEGPMRIAVLSNVEMDAMPVGTQITRIRPSETTWIKQADGMWMSSVTGSTRGTTRFTPANYAYSFIPGSRGVNAGQDVTAPVEVEAPVEDNTATPAVGQIINATQQRELPEGAIVRWQDDVSPTRWSMFYRTNTSTLPARTQFLCGPGGGEWTVNVEVVWPGVGDLSVVVRDHDEMRAMPVGTQITEHSIWWTKKDDGTWTTRSNLTADGAESGAFYLSETFRYSYIPLPNGGGAGIQK